MIERVVLDTNVVLALWVFDDPRLPALRAALSGGRMAAVRDDACDAELARVMARPRFALTPDRQAGILADWQSRASPVPSGAGTPAPPASGWTCRDPDDQKFITLALRAGATWLFTRDRALLALARRARTAGLAIVPPEALPAPLA